MSERFKPLIYLLVLLCVAINLHAIFTWSIAIIGNDGVQYLSTAKNWLAGNGFATDALIYTPHFQGVLPAPQTVWPSGYSIIIAMLSHLGIELTHAAFALNLITHAVASLLVFYVLIRMGVTQTYAALCGFLFYLMALPWVYVSELLTEPVFTTLLMAATLLLPNPKNSGVRNWFFCGALIAIAISIRYSALFFAMGVGIGIFTFLLLNYQKDQTQTLIRDNIKLLLLLLTPIAVFLYFMYNTLVVVGTLNRFTGYRDPHSIESMLREWLVITSQLLGFNSGPIINSTAALVLFFCFVLILIVLAGWFFYRKLHRTNQEVSTDSLAYFNLALLVACIHALLFVAYLTFNAMSTSPLQIRIRYLYQIYPGVYVVFCFIIYSLLHKYVNSNSGHATKAMTFAIGSLVAIYLFAQVNQTVTSRKPYLREARATHAMMQMNISNEINLATLIESCFKDHNSKASIWSTHGQHIYLHTAVPTLTHADTYVNKPFDADQLTHRIKTYNVKMFIFLDFYPNYTTQSYKDHMASANKWVSNLPGYSKISFQNEGIGEIKTVSAYTTCDLPD